MLLVILDPTIPAKSLNEIKSFLVSTLASHGQLSKALLVYEEINKAGYNLEPKVVISLIVTAFCISSAINLFKKLKDKFESDELVLEVVFDEIGLDLLWAVKNKLLLSAYTNAGDLSNARLIWREYEVAGFQYNVLSYLSSQLTVEGIFSPELKDEPFSRAMYSPSMRWRK
ncbi:hypothetical protein HN51_035056 [Arachis hypogaea]